MDIPAHIAIIMDGNGRWAKARGLPIPMGHKQGAESLMETIKLSAELGVKFLTVYAFSSENWNRPTTEVSALMQLLRFYLDNKLTELHKNQIKLKVIGDLSKMDADLQEKIKKAENLTIHNLGLQLNIALSYGSRQEIIEATKQIASHAVVGKVRIEDISADLFSGYLYTNTIPDPDLFIRTSGEYRVSNFLLWQIAYSELYFTEKLWPDFTKDDLHAAIETYSKRERRFGLRNTA